MTRQALIALGVGQCINWGVLYYAFAILVVPLQRELRVETWVVTGAFTVALLVSAALAPAIGRWGDIGRGPLVMQLGGFIAAALLLLWPLIPGVATLYVVWAALGACMAATLYDTAFLIVAHAFENPTQRLRALALITLFGGLASTVFLPATSTLETAFGWRGTVMALAGAVLASTLLTRYVTFRRAAATQRRSLVTVEHGGRPGANAVQFALLAGTFSLTSMASGALATNLVPALGERGVAPATAALVGGLMGAMQLPGRALLMNGTFGAGPTRLLAFSLVVHGAGLALIAFGTSTAIVAVGTAVFALGAGVTTLVRPHLVQTMFHRHSAGVLNGRIARHQQLARAVGPVVVAWTAGQLRYAAVFAMLAGMFVVAMLLTPVLVGASSQATPNSEAA